MKADLAIYTHVLGVPGQYESVALMLSHKMDFNCCANIGTVLQRQSHIRRLSRRKQHLYNLARHMNSSHNWDTYQHLKREVQRECRKAYNDYIGSLVDKNGAITKNYGHISKVKGRTTVEYPH